MATKKTGTVQDLRLKNERLAVKYRRAGMVAENAQARAQKAKEKFEKAKEIADQKLQKAWRISEKMAGVRGHIFYMEKTGAAIWRTETIDGYESFIRFFDANGTEIHRGV